MNAIQCDINKNVNKKISNDNIWAILDEGRL